MGSDTLAFEPALTILPPAQRHVWNALSDVPANFTLYGGIAVALRLAHRVSIDFDFFSNHPFDPDDLAAKVAVLRGAERVRVDVDTLSCRVDGDAPVIVSFYGGLRLGQVAARERAHGSSVYIASLLDLAGTKVAVVQKRAEARDYIDVDALIRAGVDLPTALAAGRVVYGHDFNPMIALKALCYFDDLPELAADVRMRLAAAAAAVDPMRLPTLAAIAARPDREAER